MSRSVEACGGGVTDADGRAHARVCLHTRPDLRVCLGDVTTCGIGLAFRASCSRGTVRAAVSRVPVFLPAAASLCPNVQGRSSGRGAAARLGSLERGCERLLCVLTS